jgi:NAD-dependent SIR2 family protein deacetylase
VSTDPMLPAPRNARMTIDPVQHLMPRIRLPDWQASPAQSAAVTTTDPAVLADALRTLPRLAVLSGAGCSTESGIPDYRDRSGQWKVGAPVLFPDFLRDPAVRQRYWARSMRGWPRFSAALPGLAHQALAALERAGRIEALLTQNVDGLHQAAGSRAVIELHGNLATVVCLGCRHAVARAEVQAWLEAENPAHCAGAPTALRPDGDAELDAGTPADFRVPDCERCGGVLKPDVVFFGETAPPQRVERAVRAVREADALLVVGTSLGVQSGLRHCREAATLGKPVIAVNLGRTRADELLRLKLEAPCGIALHALATALLGSARPTGDSP